MQRADRGPREKKRRTAVNAVRINTVFAATLATVSSFVFVMLNMPAAALNILTGAV